MGWVARIDVVVIIICIVVCCINILSSIDVIRIVHWTYTKVVHIRVYHKLYRWDLPGRINRSLVAVSSRLLPILVLMAGVIIGKTTYVIACILNIGL